MVACRVGPIVFYVVLNTATCACYLVWRRSSTSPQKQRRSNQPSNNKQDNVKEAVLQDIQDNVHKNWLNKIVDMSSLQHQVHKDWKTPRLYNSAPGALGDLKADSANKAKPVGASTDRVSIEMNPVGSQEPLWTAPKSKHEVRFAVLPSLNLMHHQLTTSTVAMCFI